MNNRTDYFRRTGNDMYLLHILSESKTALRIKEIAKRTGLNESTVKNLISRYDRNNLRQRNLVAQGSEGYSITATGRNILDKKFKNYFENQQEAEKLRAERKNAETEYSRIRSLCLIFIDEHPEIEELLRKRKPFHVSQGMVLNSSPDLLDYLLDKPAVVLEHITDCIKELFLANDEFTPEGFVCLSGDYQRIEMFSLRKEYKGQLITLRAKVQVSTEVFPRIILSRFECPMCGNIIAKLQVDSEFRPPTSCSCGRKGSFRKLSVVTKDYRYMMLESDMASPLGITVKCSAESEGLIANIPVQLGEHYRVNGVLELPHQKDRNGKLQNSLDYKIRVLGIESINPLTNIMLKPTTQDVEKFQEIKTDPFGWFAKNIFPEWAGSMLLKKIIILPNFSSYYKRIHLLLVGDPELAKTKLAKRAVLISPINGYTDLQGATKAGLIGAADRDEHTGSWYIRAGFLASHHKGTVVLDEMDKVPIDLLNSLHNVLEDQEVTLAKAGLNQTSPAQTAVIFCCNPKGDKVDEFKPLHEQIDNMRRSLLSRVDYFVVLKDVVDSKMDALVAKKTAKGKLIRVDEKKLVLARKYCAQALCKTVVMTDGAQEIIESYYVSMRQSMKKAGTGWEGRHIGARTSRSLAVQAEAIARLHHSCEIRPCHVRLAKSIIDRIATPLDITTDLDLKVKEDDT